MNFCDNCGADLREHKDARFCWNCGNSLNISELSNTRTPISSSLDFDSNKNSSFKSGFDTYGIILTHVPALSVQLNCNETEIEMLISDYIESLEKTGHQYIFIDASNNSYKTLSQDDNWVEFVELLKNVYSDLSPRPEYLFIIGGHDVIPMAIINNEPACYADDIDIDTDMPYSYLKADDFENLLWSGKIFRESVYLYSGRLPIPSDSHIDTLAQYLNKAVKALDYGVAINSCYGMTAESWVAASRKIIENVDTIKKLHTSPDIDLYNVDGVFNTSAQLYYFNLHGSDAPGSPEFFGDSDKAISPDFLRNAENLNFLISEACYGAKFIDYDIDDCMLLTAIHSNTITFAGSSRVAFGAANENLSSADIIAKSFIDILFNGYSSGKALSQARIDVYDACSDDHFEYGTTSAVEFNLFGEPILSSSKASKKKKNELKYLKSGLKSKSFSRTRPTRKEIIFKNVEKGILNDTRNLVNKEVSKIRDIINKSLYEQFNVEPRDLTAVFHITGKYGEKTYNYVYKNKNKSDINNVYSVFSDNHGKIKSILITK